MERRGEGERGTVVWPELWMSVLVDSGAAAIAFGSSAWLFWRTRVADRRDADERDRRERIGRVQTAVYADLVIASVRWGGLVSGGA